jgi:tetratricopeptide (TPR) repeat protein
MDHQLVIPEHDNFRAALQWSLGARRPKLGLRLAVALDVFWVTADPVEGIRWLERLLAATDGVSGALAARALRVYGGLVLIAGDFDRAKPFLQQSLAEFRAAGKDDGAATCLFLLAISADRRGDYVTAQTLLEQSLDLHVKTGSRKGEAQVRGMFAAHAFRAGEHERGLELLDRAIALAHDAGFPWWEKNELCFLAERLLELGRPKDAQAAASEALQIATRIRDRVGQVDALAIMAHIASAQAEAKIAGRIWGVIEAEAKRAPFPGWERTRRLHAGAILASDEFEIARQAGAGLTLQTAVDEVLEQHLE